MNNIIIKRKITRDDSYPLEDIDIFIQYEPCQYDRKSRHQVNINATYRELTTTCGSSDENARRQIQHAIDRLYQYQEGNFYMTTVSLIAYEEVGSTLVKISYVSEGGIENTDKDYIEGELTDDLLNELLADLDCKIAYDKADIEEDEATDCWIIQDNTFLSVIPIPELPKLPDQTVTWAYEHNSMEVTFHVWCHLCDRECTGNPGHKSYPTWYTDPDVDDVIKYIQECGYCCKDCKEEDTDE